MARTKKPKSKKRGSATVPGTLQPARRLCEHFEEPSLEFGSGRLHIDQRTGISLFGPRSIDQARHPEIIKIGMVGSGKSIESARKWVSSCLDGVEGDAEHLRFPGFTDELGFYSKPNLDGGWTEVLTQQELDEIKKTKVHSEKFRLALDTVCEKVRILSRKDHAPDVILLALPDELLSQCQVTDYVDPQLGTVHRDLRRALKAELMRFQKPTQILLQRTSEASPTSRSVDHKSVCAWNIFTGMYFKAGGVPWAPVSLKPGTCYVGISFYRPLGTAKASSVRASVAQAFDEHGEGLILRGPEFQWDENEFGKSPHLSAAHAEQLLAGVLEQYRSTQGQMPSRVVVHKSSRFWPEERQGLQQAISSRGVPKYDFVAVNSTSELRLIRAGQYPVLRGTHFALNDIHFLYTTGFLTAQNGYPAGHVPSPLQVADHIGDSPISDVLKEILILTRMNWNSSNPFISTPITLRFSDLVGDILREIPTDREPLPQFKFYV